MSSARDSNWSPQPPNLQELEKNEAAAMPVMFTALVHSPGREGGGGGPGAGVVNEEAEVSGPGIGTGQSAEQRSRHRAARQDSGGRSWEAGGAVGGGGGGVAGGIRHDLPTCWYDSRTDCGVVSKISLILAHIHTL